MSKAMICDNCNEIMKNDGPLGTIIQETYELKINSFLSLGGRDWDFCSMFCLLKWIENNSKQKDDAKEVQDE